MVVMVNMLLLVINMFIVSIPVMSGKGKALVIVLLVRILPAIPTIARLLCKQ